MYRIILPSLAALALAACGGSEPEQTAQNTPAPAETVEHSVEAATPDAADTAAAAVDEVVEEVEDHSATLAALGEAYLDADLANGARQYRRCQACHTLTEGGRHLVGPNLHGIFNAPAAAKEGFSYSSQLEAAGLVWDVATLDAWIENPRAMVPGNRMSFVGLRDPNARRDVIAYMAVETAR